MDLGLGGKRALVAAASSGLGFAVARTLAAEGAVVAICSRDEERISHAAERIARETRARVHYRACDVREPDQIRAWISDAASRMDGLDIVIPNAGGPPPGRFDDLTELQWDSAYRATLLPAVRMAREARAYLGRGSSMLFMTSTSVKEPIDNLLLSGVFRAGVAALAKALAREWAPDGIRVNHLIPGRFATPRVDLLDEVAAAEQGIAKDELQAGLAARIPAGRYGTPDEFAAAAAFLVSKPAVYITGATLAVDGGALRSVM